jgi:hypothetical protein
MLRYQISMRFARPTPGETERSITFLPKSDRDVIADMRQAGRSLSQNIALIIRSAWVFMRIPSNP